MEAPRGLDESRRLGWEGRGRTAVTDRYPASGTDGPRIVLCPRPTDHKTRWSVLLSSASGRLRARIRHCDEHSGALPSVGGVAAASASFRRSTDKRCRPTYDTR